MAATASLSQVIPYPIDSGTINVYVYGIVTLTGTYPTNGDTLNLSTLGIPSNTVPTAVYFYETTPAPGPQSGRSFVYVPGTNQSNGLLEVFSGGTQMLTGAYGTPPFAITNFSLAFEAVFPYGV